MNRTINEIYDIIKEKKYYAQCDLSRKHYPKKQERLKGEVEAYTDVICLIESSGVLSDDTREVED